VWNTSKSPPDHDPPPLHPRLALRQPVVPRRFALRTPRLPLGAMESDPIDPFLFHGAPGYLHVSDPGARVIEVVGVPEVGMNVLLVG